MIIKINDIEVKYLYFEHYIYRDNNKIITSEGIQNANVLVFINHTNSDGYWGFTNITKTSIGYTYIAQYWIDFTKYTIEDAQMTTYIVEAINDIKYRIME